MNCAVYEDGKKEEKLPPNASIILPQHQNPHNWDFPVFNPLLAGLGHCLVNLYPEALCLCSAALFLTGCPSLPQRTVTDANSTVATNTGTLETLSFSNNSFRSTRIIQHNLESTHTCSDSNDSITDIRVWKFVEIYFPYSYASELKWYARLVNGTREMFCKYLNYCSLYTEN